MDVVVTYALALPTIFLAAFLAAAMENVRERARTRKWVMRNLRVLAATEHTGSPDLLRAALRRWLEAESPTDMPEETWRQAWFVGVWSLPDLTPLVRSEAATFVPAEVFASLQRLDADLSLIRSMESYLSDLFLQDVAPLWYERRVPLEGSDRRRVEHFAYLVDEVTALVTRTRDRTFADFRRALRAA